MRAPLLSTLLALAACAGAPPSPPPSGPGVAPPAVAAAVGAVLDDFHAAAAEADEARYLAHFAPEAVFLGTDASERWTLDEFTGYVRAHFPRGGWTYRARDRHVVVAGDGELAWFDELLVNEKYGELRGTGVVRLVGGSWRIAQYNLTFTIPNDVAARVVEVVRGR